MRVIKSTGLVPVRQLKRGIHPTGTIYGLAPKFAIAGVLAGDVALHPVPEDVETFEVTGPAPPEPEPVLTVVVDDLTIEIPEDWEDLQWMRKVKLAELIQGAPLEVPEGQKPLEIAIPVITAELARRAAAKAPSEDSGNPET